MDISGGNTTYYMTIDNSNGLIFSATSKVSTELPLTMVNDKVKISYQKSDNGLVDIVEFDNLNINSSGKVEKSKDNKTENTIENIQQQ